MSYAISIVKNVFNIHELFKITQKTSNIINLIYTPKAKNVLNIMIKRI